jgi:hypothetical protein
MARSRDTSRKPDAGPENQLAAMCKRLKAALNAWMEATDHLRSPR